MSVKNHWFLNTSFLFAFWWLVTTFGTSWTAECDAGMFKVRKGGEMICCKKCNNVNVQDPCHDGLSLPEECRCNEGYGCDEIRCLACLQLPTCEEGQELKRIGTDMYDYKCEACSNGTYYDSISGFCEPAQRPLHPTQSSTDKELQRSTPCVSYKKEILVLPILVAFLVLMSVIIHVLIWKIKSRVQIPGEHPDCNIIMAQKNDIDSWSCQYPEEEHGEVTMEKPSIC